VSLLCGWVAEWSGSQTCDQQVAGSNPGRRAAECNPGQVIYTCASVTKQYNLVPTNGWWCWATGEVTAGLSMGLPLRLPIVCMCVSLYMSRIIQKLVECGQILMKFYELKVDGKGRMKNWLKFCKRSGLDPETEKPWNSSGYWLWAMCILTILIEVSGCAGLGTKRHD